MANIINTWKQLSTDQRDLYAQLAAEGNEFAKKLADSYESNEKEEKPLVVPEQLKQYGDQLKTKETNTVDQKQNEGYQQLGKEVTKINAPEKIEKINTGFVAPPQKKTWRDYLFGSKDDQEFNNKRKQTIAAAHDLITNLGNLYATSQGAVSQKFETATDKLAKQKEKDAKKDKADKEMALSVLKLQNQKANDDRNYNLKLGEYGLKQNEDTRQNQLQPYKILEQKGKADYQTGRAQIQAATAGDILRQEKAKADTEETKAKFAPQQQQATLGQKRASTNSLNANAAHSRALTNKVNRTGTNTTSTGGGKQEGIPVWNKDKQQYEYYKTKTSANTAAKTYGTWQEDNIQTTTVKSKYDPVLNRTTSDTSHTTRTGSGYPMTKEEYEKQQQQKKPKGFIMSSGKKFNFSDK